MIRLWWCRKYFMVQLKPCQKNIRNGFPLQSHIIRKVQNIGDGSPVVPLNTFSGQILPSYITWYEFVILAINDTF